MIADRVAALDSQLFAHVESQTYDGDRKSLLAVHNAVAARTDGFSYLEVGSHLGGTLQAVIADPRCARVVSIDSRPQWQPDDRPGFTHFEYPDNSTERMLKLLQHVPGADLSKLETVEESTENLAPGRFARPDFCFIDAEHTHRAALRDARFCRTVMQGAGIIAFHDFEIIGPAILDLLRETPGPQRGYLLSFCVFVIELGAVPTLLDDPGVRSQLRPQRGWIMANRMSVQTWLLAYMRRRRLQASPVAPGDRPN
jgi:Methyltransferase domain